MEDPDKYPDNLDEITFKDLNGCLTAPDANNAYVNTVSPSQEFDIYL